MNISDRTLAGQIVTAIDSTGAKAPQAIAGGYAEVTRVCEEARNLAPRGDSLVLAVEAALSEGREPAADREVQRILIASQIGNEGLVAMVEAIAYDRFRQTCLEHAEATVHAWRKPFDQAATDLASCFDRIGPVPLDDAGSILQAGGDIADVWAVAQRASRTIETIGAGWTALVTLTRTAQTNPDYRPLQLAEITYPEWLAGDLRRKKLKPWEFLLAGLRLSLPTAAEYRGRVQAIVDGMTRQETVIDTARSAVAGHEIRVAATL